MSDSDNNWVDIEFTYEVKTTHKYTGIVSVCLNDEDLQEFKRTGKLPDDKAEDYVYGEFDNDFNPSQDGDEYKAGNEDEYEATITSIDSVTPGDEVV